MKETRLGGMDPELSALFSERAGRTIDPPINYMMQKALAGSDLISLAAGFVDYESLPVQEVSQILKDLLGDTEATRAALQYGTTEGLVSLRRQFLDRLIKADNTNGCPAGYTIDNTLLTTGSQQLLYLLTEVLLDAGDVVIVGHPSYWVFMGALKTSGARCISVPLDEEGMRADLLAEELSALEQSGQLHRLKLIYLITYFQNPSGISVSDARRDEIMDVVKRYRRKQNFYVAEDAAYRELRYDGEDIPSLRSRDADGRTVCYLGTFSKPFSPGLKTGFGLLPEALVKPVLRFKGNHDFGSGNFSQHLLDRAMSSGLLDSHVEELRRTYHTKRDVMLTALDEFMPGGTRLTRAGGGLYVWVTLPDNTPTGPDSKLFELALGKGVLYVPGEFFYPEDCPRQPRTNELRLSFGVGTLDQLREGVRRLGEAVKEVCNSR